MLITDTHTQRLYIHGHDHTNKKCVTHTNNAHTEREREDLQNGKNVGLYFSFWITNVTEIN